MMRRLSTKVLLSAAAAVLALLLSMGIGSVSISVPDAMAILGNKLFGAALPSRISGITVSIFWDIRMPRTLTAFFVGACLAVSGTVMQSVLQNPLASSFTLGVSSGASLGAAVIMVTGFSLPLAGFLTLPLAGFLFGLVTVFAAIILAERLDRNMHNQTIILIGMVLSLFVNALLTLLSALTPDSSHQILLWSMGSFSSKNWGHVAVMLPVCLLGTLFLMRFSREMDIMTFGDEQAYAIGVDIRKMKKLLIGAAAFLTGTAVCFTGVIGFIDLIAPHVVRKIFGSSHRLVLPMSALFGGAFMAVADLVSRTVLSPREIPVGSVTALIGAPFFAYVFFRKDRK
jgi:iron complex transport system permease protein